MTYIQPDADDSRRAVERIAFDLRQSQFPLMDRSTLAEGWGPRPTREDLQRAKDRILESSLAYADEIERMPAPQMVLGIRCSIASNGPAVIHLLRSPQLREHLGEEEASAADNLVSRINSVLRAIEHANAEYFGPLRQSVRSGALRGATLIAELERHSDDRGLLSGHSGADVFFDKLLGIPRMGSVTQELHPGMIPYGPLDLGSLKRISDHLQLTAADTFCDLGTGLGRPPIFFSLVSEARCFGVEYQTPLYQAGAEVIERNGLSSVELINGDVREFDFDRANVFYMFNPFSGRLLEDVVRKLGERGEAALARGEKVKICAVAMGGPFERLRAFKSVKKDGFLQFFETVN